MSICLTCAWSADTGITIDSSRSNTLWASTVGVNESSIRRHRAHMKVGEAGVQSFPDLFLRSEGIDEGIVTSRGKSIRDPETGSWEKVTWKPNAKALADTLNYDDLKESLEGWVPDDVATWETETKTSVLMASDLQIGKAMNRGGGTPETIERVRASFAAFAGYVFDHSPERVVIVDGGDPIENCWNTPDQMVTNDLPVPEQIRVFRRLMLEGIKLLAPLVPELVYVAVPSNHGAARVGYKANGGTVDADFGLEISYQLEDAVSMNEHLSHVTFVRPESLNETAEVEVSGTKLAFHHGHQSNGSNGHGKWWAGQAHGRMAGWDADILVTSHFHSMGLEQSGNGRWIIKAASSDASSDWFTNRTGESALQGMTTFDVLDGQWSSLRLV